MGENITNSWTFYSHFISVMRLPIAVCWQGNYWHLRLGLILPEVCRINCQLAIITQTWNFRGSGRWFVECWVWVPIPILLLPHSTPAKICSSLVNIDHLVVAYCLLDSDQTVKIKVVHLSRSLLRLVLQLLQVEANIPNILVHTNSAEQRDDFLQTPNSQPKHTIRDGGSTALTRTNCSRNVRQIDPWS